MVAVGDYVASRNAWRRAAPTLTRALPPAFAIAVKRPLQRGDRDARRSDRWLARPALRPRRLDLADRGAADGSRRRRCDAARADVSRDTDIARGSGVRACRRARAIAPGILRDARAVGEHERRRVYPDFAQIARYAWLAGDRRLQEIGVKTYRRRGEGTDFKQLSEYRVGDSVRHIDWRATQRLGKPIVRQFQDERDQCVMLLIDCGRRMRADDRQRGSGTTHFDQVLNAAMLLTYVALRQGDAVGAMTFGTPAGQERWFAPAKGIRTLNALMGQFYGVQPSPSPRRLRRRGARSAATATQARARGARDEFPRRGQLRAWRCPAPVAFAAPRHARQPPRAHRRRAGRAAADQR